jgi:two-component system phosphorelay protein LuxU
MKSFVSTEKIDELSHDIGKENLPVLFSIFIGELEEYAQALSHGSIDQNKAEEQLKAISHSLKSSAASFGAERLCEVATRLDSTYKTGKGINTSENVKTMIDCLNITREKFLKLIQ